MFGSERAIAFVAMATPEDLRANAEYIRMADEFVEVPGGSNANNYANVSLIVDLAKRYKVDAVFAGWGHASENPALPGGLSLSSLRVSLCIVHQETNDIFMQIHSPRKVLSLWVPLADPCLPWVTRLAPQLLPKAPASPLSLGPGTVSNAITRSIFFFLSLILE